MTTVSRTITDPPRVISLDDGSVHAVEVGAKAANLARARAAGLPVIDGFVIPPPLAARIATTPRGERTADVEIVRMAWGLLSRWGSEPVVVRSSSLAEDTARSSQAGVFESVVDVHGWDDFLDAVRAVTTSGRRADAVSGSAPIAVLVQRHVDPQRSGVLFTTDPVTGRADRLVVAAIEGGPQALVSGTETGTRIVLDRWGRAVEGPRRSLLGRRQRRALVRLARRAETLFGSPQDIEWAISGADRPVLLQSRPITVAAAVVAGPVFGPGPVAETFPDPLRPLEQDLWLTPLRAALRVALGLTGGASRRALERSPVVVSVEGRPAVDLDLLEGGPNRRRGLARLDPRPPARRLRVAWQVGRLRIGLPGLIDDLVTALDRELTAVPTLDSLDDDALLRLLERGRASLRAAHGYELLAGILTTSEGATGADLGLASLRLGRRDGMTDAEIVAAHPAVLALAPPAIGGAAVLPSVADPVASEPSGGSGRLDGLGPREALRLRIRWLLELTARAASVLGCRLAAAGQIPQPDAVAGLDLVTLARVVHDGAIVDPEPPSRAGPPLPARFRLASDGSPVAVTDGRTDGTAAGGGRGQGIVDQGPRPSPGSVLVVDTLDPRLAPVLSGLAGLVAVTGSPLSHLAILAREHGVATVVGVADATKRFPPGTELLVDGTAGVVRVVSPAPTDGSAS